MTGFLLASLSCFILGVLTTLHPCPMTTNMAAISLLSGFSAKYKKVFSTYSLFVTGYIGAYFIISVLLSAGVFIKSSVSFFLQNSISIFLGPILIIVGMILTDMMRLNRLYKGRVYTWTRSRQWKGIYSLPMGLLIALSFCPATAAIFFGLLIPLTVQHGQIVLFPLLYGLGASVPLIIIVIFIIHGNRRIINERWQKKIPLIAGWILIMVGIVISLQRIYLA
jgi:hypothetical protein